MTRIVQHGTRSGIYVTEVPAAWELNGLAVTPGVGDSAGSWSVTHVASGYVVFKAMTSESRAIAAAKNLLDCGDWERPRGDLRTDSELRNAAKRVASVVQAKKQW